MSKENLTIPFESPLVPVALGLENTIQFRCYKGISCFNACCKNADITLTPYDIVRLKNRLGMTSTEFLVKHTVLFEMDGSGMLGVKLKTQDNELVCLLVSEEGCTVYEDRPSACRYYPVGLMAMRPMGSPSDEAHYFLVKEEHCKGHEEDRTLTLAEYRTEQGVEEYDATNREWYQIILKKRSSGPTVGKPSQTSFQMFFMCSYDIDRFRNFVMSDNFKAVYDLDEKQYEEFNKDEISLLKFSFRLMKQVLFGENTIPVNQDAADKRFEERKDILAKRRDMEIEKALAEDNRYEPSE